jgi:hypothetical protein
MLRREVFVTVAGGACGRCAGGDVPAATDGSPGVRPVSGQHWGHLAQLSAAEHRRAHLSRQVQLLRNGGPQPPIPADAAVSVLQSRGDVARRAHPTALSQPPAPQPCRHTCRAHRSTAQLRMPPLHGRGRVVVLVTWRVTSFFLHLCTMTILWRHSFTYCMMTILWRHCFFTSVLRHYCVSIQTHWQRVKKPMVLVLLLHDGR